MPGHGSERKAAESQHQGLCATCYTLAYNYYLPGTTPTGCPTAAAGTGNNGNVIGYTYTDTVYNYAMSHSALYVYDTLNRLVCAQATSPNNNPAATYDLVFSYNPDGSGHYGNMACVQNSNTHGPCPQWAYNAGTNRLTTSGFPYDAAGNLTQDSSNAPSHTWQWDGEGRAASVDPGSSPTWNFTYNALGDRALWAYGNSGGADQHLFDPAGNWLGVAGSYSLVRFGSRHMLAYTGSDTVFNHVNQLDATTMGTNHSGTTVEDVLFYPWGDQWQSSASGYSWAMPYRDLKTNTDLTTFRVYSPNLGRWLSPDSVRGDVTNPQSLNLYPYVTDNPTTLTDPSGLCGCGGGGFGFGGGGGGGWGGGCGGGGFGGGFGGRGGGPPPPPPTIPIPGPVTTSTVGGGLFSDPFSFMSVEGAPPPWVDIVDSLPLPPSPSSSSAGSTSCRCFYDGGLIRGTGCSYLCHCPGLPSPMMPRPFFAICSIHDKNAAVPCVKPFEITVSWPLPSPPVSKPKIIDPADYCGTGKGSL